MTVGHWLSGTAYGASGVHAVLIWFTVV